MIKKIASLLRFVFLCFLFMLVTACDTHAVTLTAGNYSVMEGDSGDSVVRIVISVDGSINSDINVPVEIINITTNENDYETMQSSLMLQKGKKTAVYLLKIKGDKNIEKDEELFVRLNLSDFDNIYFNKEKQSGLIKVSILNDDGGQENHSKRDDTKRFSDDKQNISLVRSKWVAASDLYTEHKISPAAFGRVLTVGPNGEFSKPSQAARHAHDGDIIEIDARGDYLNDFVIWRKHNLIIKGINGRPHIRANTHVKNGKAIWVIKGNNTTIFNIELSGAKVYSHNGSAIRLEGTNLYLLNSYIHNNESGILTGRNLNSEVYIENCEFSENGFGKGKTHNIYIGRIRKFILKNSYSHNAYAGHTVKSRAETNIILYNRLFEGKASYAIDLSNGGDAIVLGNIIYQGPSSFNRVMIAYGAEGLKHIKNELLFAFNTLQNSHPNGVFINIKPGTNAILVNNIFSGHGKKLMNGKALLYANVIDSALFTKFNSNDIEIDKTKDNLVIDKAIKIITQDGDVVMPTHQISQGKTVDRNMRGNGYDIGAIEYN